MSSQPPLPDPAAYALQSADGSIDAALVGSKADCEFWSRADNEPQSGWQVVGIHTEASLRAYGEACAAAAVAAEPGAEPKIDLDDDSYNHIPLKPAFTVQATYKLIGKGRDMKCYVVWVPDRGQTRKDGREIEAISPTAACEDWAQRDDAESADFSIVRGNDVEVMVAELGSSLKPFRYSVSGESVPSYRATMMHGKGRGET